MACNTTTAELRCDKCGLYLSFRKITATRMIEKLAAAHRAAAPKCKANTIVRDQ